MDRHVIKGRGENRGKYLCYARMAGLSPSDKFVWLPEQRKAARWDDPEFRAYSYDNRIAREYDGYFVRLVARKGVIELVDGLRAFIEERASEAPERPKCYWLDGDWSDNEGPNYCWECACKAVDAAFAKDPQKFVNAYGDYHGDWKTSQDYYDRAIDGGWSMDHDHPPSCETCGVQLEGVLTEYGADQEIHALTTDCKPSFDDADAWKCLDIAVMNIRDDDPRWNKIAKVIDAAREQEARAALLSVLAARMELGARL